MQYVKYYEIILMMKQTKAFTLVELLVVITILAILATVAFISLQGYTQDAKNSKVGYDLLNVSTLIETKLTKWNISLTNIVTTSSINNSVDDNINTFASYSSDTWTGVIIDETPLTWNYNVGSINFILLQQDGSDYFDAEGNPYIIAYVVSGDVAYYQVAGQVKLADGNYETIVKGNYLDEGGTNDTDGLISVLSGAITAGLWTSAIMSPALNLY